MDEILKQIDALMEDEKAKLLEIVKAMPTSGGITPEQEAADIAAAAATAVAKAVADYKVKVLADLEALGSDSYEKMKAILA